MAHPKFPILTFFNYSHLPPHLQKVSKPFHKLAHQLVKSAPCHHMAEKATALRKLLEAKDAAVRCYLPAAIKPETPLGDNPSDAHDGQDT